MGSSYGQMLKLTIFGQSHSPAIGMTLEGITAGKQIDMEQLQEFLNRRAPGRNEFSTPRKEADVPEFISGLVGNVTCGTPVTAVIHNTNTRSKDYSQLKIIPRPGHADLTAQIKYAGFQDYAGGGHFSGRLTAPLCIAGGICKQLLEEHGVHVMARIVQIADIQDGLPFTEDVSQKDFPVVSEAAKEQMKQRILEAKEDRDSVGGVIECMATGVPAGLGDPMFDGMENRIASIIFAIPAVKGIEFGTGFAASGMRGSENNDAFALAGDKEGTALDTCYTDAGVRKRHVVTVTNHSGGILGGITNGMPLIFRTALKPTPSIAKEQRSVNLETMDAASLEVKGRHDPCIVQRAVPCVEAAAAIALYDALLYQEALKAAR